MYCLCYFCYFLHFASLSILPFIRLPLHYSFSNFIFVPSSSLTILSSISCSMYKLSFVVIIYYFVFKVGPVAQSV